MRAPVYRNVEASSTIGGLTMMSFLLELVVAFLAIQFLSFLLSLATIAGPYVLLRLASYGRPPMYWQHYVLWRVRQANTAGRLSAAARFLQPRFPFGPYR